MPYSLPALVTGTPSVELASFTDLKGNGTREGLGARPLRTATGTRTVAHDYCTAPCTTVRMRRPEAKPAGSQHICWIENFRKNKTCEWSKKVVPQSLFKCWQRRRPWAQRCSRYPIDRRERQARLGDVLAWASERATSNTFRRVSSVETLR